MRSAALGLSAFDEARAGSALLVHHTLGTNAAVNAFLLAAPGVRYLALAADDVTRPCAVTVQKNKWNAHGEHRQQLEAREPARLLKHMSAEVVCWVRLRHCRRPRGGGHEDLRS